MAARTPLNTLRYDPQRCTGCGMCIRVCPQRVFQSNGRTARLSRPERCMECGACMRNCAAGAIEVASGVGCATAMFMAALLGKKEACCGGGESCCG